MIDYLILLAAVLVGTFGFSVIFGMSPRHLAAGTLYAERSLDHIKWGSIL